MGTAVDSLGAALSSKVRSQVLVASAISPAASFPSVLEFQLDPAGLMGICIFSHAYADSVRSVTEWHEHGLSANV